MRASVVIPTLNEAEGLPRTLEAFYRAASLANRTLFLRDPVEWEVLVIDGASTDGTPEIARRLGARVVNEPRKGYGRAYRTGFDRVQGEYVATLDGDGTYPADKIPWMLLHLIHHDRDFLTGDRLTYLEEKAMTTEHRIGNLALNLTFRVLFHTCLKSAPARALVDSQSGLWVFRRSILPKLRLTQDGMAFSEELKLEVLLRGFRLEEIPIHYTERWGRPKLSSWRDGYRNLTYLFQKRVEISQETRRARQVTVPAEAGA